MLSGCIKDVCNVSQILLTVLVEKTILGSLPTGASLTDAMPSNIVQSKMRLFVILLMLLGVILHILLVLVVLPFCLVEQELLSKKQQV